MNDLIELFLTFAKVGAFTFGGGYAMISLIEDICVSAVCGMIVYGSFKELFKKRIDKQIIVHPKGYSEVDEVIKIPPYMMHLI